MIKNIEEVINKIKNLLDNNLSTKLSELETEYADNILLPKPEIYISINVLPQEQEMIILDGKMSQILEQRDNYALIQHIVSIILWIEDSEANFRIVSKIYRYMRAIYEILKDKPQLELEAIKINFKNIYFTPIIKEKELSFFKGAYTNLYIDVDRFF